MMRHYEVSVRVPVATEPVTLEEAKAQLRLTAGYTADDTYITSLISVARDRCESYCNQFFAQQIISINFTGGFDNEPLELPFPGLDVTSLKYFDEDYAENTIDALDYSYDDESRLLVPVGEWPTDVKSIRVIAATTPPEAFEGVKHAILMIVTDLYELRTESVIGASVAVNPAVTALLYPYRFNLSI